MKLNVTAPQLTEAGVNHESALRLIEQMNQEIRDCVSTAEAWKRLSKNALSAHPFPVHLCVFTALFPDWREQPETAPACLPDSKTCANANITQFMQAMNMPDIHTLHTWSTQHYQDFWQRMVEQLHIVFTEPPQRVCDLTQGIESPAWFPGAALNIADSCFTAPAHAIAIIYEDENQQLIRMTYDELNRLTNRVANSLLKQGFMAGDAIAIAMPMNVFAVAIYLGIIKMGGVVVSIADSFSTQEIATRLRIAHAKAIFTQDFSSWSDKKIPLYEKIKTESQSANTVRAIVLPCQETVTLSLQAGDLTWKDFLVEKDNFTSHPCSPMTACNILFSSGTTGDPKAIAWNHTTPIKAASDAYFHQNIQPGHVLSWPTNLGWMMGPWLIFAALINQATMALYVKAPKDRAFGEFIARAGVTMLGLVPTLVASWRQTHCMEKLDWNRILTFSSSGECSNPEDMLYLMSLAGYKPVIEYCGGTEIGGAYLSSTVLENNYPSLFSTTTMGLDIFILDEQGKPASVGEVAIIPPSLGLSTTLLNADHYQVYYANMPKTAQGKILRRHGDQIKQYDNGYYSVLGRVDDTMKLGGIKTSAAEIERALAGLPEIIETAAIAIQPRDNGPSQLIIYACTQATLDKSQLMKDMQKRLNAQLNPLFKIYDVVLVSELPKTASNKIMRRVLRKTYQEKMTSP